MIDRFEWVFYLIGFLQLGVLFAAAMVPLRMKWRTEIAAWPRVFRQLFWMYGCYVALGIASLGLICLTNSAGLAAGSALARGVCWYGAVFWGVRLAMQAVLDAKPYLTTLWLRLSFHTLTVAFACLTIVYGLAAVLPR
jgi:hypothetical protein